MEFENLLFNYRAGIIVSIFEIAIKFPDCQLKVVSMLLGALHAVENDRHDEVVFLILYLYTFDKFQNKLWQPIANLQGCLIIQHLMKFESKNIEIIVNSILKIPSDVKISLVKDQTSSRLIESVLDSTTSKKNKRSIIESFVGEFCDLACDKYASHFVDKCFNNSNIEFKVFNIFFNFRKL
jgi:hypothetical protein